VREANYDQPEEVMPDLPAKLYRILHRALAKNPADRYQSAAEMLADVEEFVFERALRPNARDFAQYLKALFEEEFAEEEKALWDKSKIHEIGEKEENGQQTPLTGTHDNTVSLTDTLWNEKLKQFKQTLFKGMSRQLAKVLRFKKQILAQKANRNKKSTRSGFKFAALKPGLVVLAFLVVVALGIKQISFSRVQPEDTSLASQAAVVEEPGELSKIAAGKAALEAKQYILALTLFEEILAGDPSMMKDFSEFYVNALLGQAAELIKTDSEQSRKLLLKALKIDPDNISGLSNLGFIYMGRNNFPKAIETYLKVTDLAPRLPDTFFNLGYMYAVSKNYQEAKIMYRRVVELNPAFTDEALFNLAVVNEKLGEHKQCINNLEQAIALNPGNESAKKYLRQLKRKTGDKKG
jgi:tetratricopeptide (TPR) repeat protein